MLLTRRLLPVSAALVVAALAAPAFAQGAGPGATPPRVRGTIEHLDGATLTVKAREGGDVAIKLPADVRVGSFAKASLSDIKAGTFIGTAAISTGGDTMRAIEVVIFPEALRGRGEGHRAWDLLPESTMTNATVAETVKAVNGEGFKLTYPGGEKTVVVPPEAPVVTIAPAERADLKVGAQVVVTVEKGADGALAATSVAVSKNGVNPPI